VCVVGAGMVGAALVALLRKWPENCIDHSPIHYQSAYSNRGAMSGLYCCAARHIHVVLLHVLELQASFQTSMPHTSSCRQEPFQMPVLSDEVMFPVC